MDILSISKGSPDFPPLLTQIPDPPKVIYARGDLSLLKSYTTLGIVGTRKATAYGLSITEKLTKELATRGIIIISGLARGIDATAHKATLEVGGKTIAVLGNSLNTIYPPEHKGLAEDIIKNGGLIISEYAVGEEIFKANFVARNRIIAGLSRAVLVTEAPDGSGALITASLALDYNREVLAVPGDITRETSYGTNKLIGMGAKVVTGVSDILEVYNLLPLTDIRPLNTNFSENQKKIIEFLSKKGSLNLAELAEVTSIEITELSQELTQLELAEKIRTFVDGKYTLT